MINKMRSVIVHCVPAELTTLEVRRFLKQLTQHFASGRPRIVLDCSQVREMDDQTTHLLLCCLEEAMKNNGDVKLAALSRDAEAVLRQTGVIRLFEVYPNPASAINSFQGYLNSDPAPAFATVLASESAA